MREKSQSARSATATDRPASAEASVGVLMLETQFPRILGDIGHPDSWPFPVHYHIVSTATADRALQRDPGELTPLFIDGAKQLIAAGVAGITTSCGFLSLVQEELARSVPVPVATSSLMQAALVQATLAPGQRVGVLTIDSSRLTQAHLAAARVPPGTAVMGTRLEGHFAQSILNDAPKLDVDLARQDNVLAAQELVKQHPDVAAIVLECTNMVPYAADIHRAVKLPVYTIRSFICWFQSGLQPQSFPSP